jgi:hypothetical protein
LAVPSNEDFHINALVKMEFSSGRKIRVDGVMTARGGSAGHVTLPIRLVNASDTTAGIKLVGGMRLQNGGCIKF